MDQRVPGQDAGDGVVDDGEVLHRPELVPTARVGCLRMGDELGNHVDSRCVDAQRTKVIGNMARPTAQVEYRARSVRQMSPDEGEVVGVYLLARPEQPDVELRDGCICLPDLFQVHPVTIGALGLAERRPEVSSGMHVDSVALADTTST